MNPPSRILAPVGLAPDDVAALAALIAQLPAANGVWRLGDAADADLVLVDLDTTDGVIGQADAITQDIPCVALDVPGGLARPFGADALAEVLAAASGNPRRAQLQAVVMSPPPAAAPGVRAGVDAPAGPITRGTLQFGLAEPEEDADIPFDLLFSPDLVGRIPDGNAGSASSAEPSIQDAKVAGDEVPAPFAGTVTGERDSADPIDDAVLPVVDPEPAAAAAAAGTASTPPEPIAEAAAPTASAPVPPPADPAAGTAAAPRPAAPKASYPLVEYLTGRLIGLPSRIAPAGLPEIVIDPHAQIFHADGDLATLAAYFDLLLPRTQWLAVLPSQLAEVRVRLPGRPYAVLRFWHALRGAGRSLASHLDPGGTYALRGVLPLGADLPRVQRVLAALAAPRGLAEVASVSGTSVVEVYEVVSALDAIGQLDWTPRKRPAAR